MAIKLLAFILTTVISQGAFAGVISCYFASNSVHAFSRVNLSAVFQNRALSNLMVTLVDSDETGRSRMISKTIPKLEASQPSRHSTSGNYIVFDLTPYFPYVVWGLQCRTTIRLPEGAEDVAGKIPNSTINRYCGNHKVQALRCEHIRR